MGSEARARVERVVVEVIRHDGELRREAADGPDVERRRGRGRLRGRIGVQLVDPGLGGVEREGAVGVVAGRHGRGAVGVADDLHHGGVGERRADALDVAAGRRLERDVDVAVGPDARRGRPDVRHRDGLRQRERARGRVPPQDVEVVARGRDVGDVDDLVAAVGRARGRILEGRLLGPAGTGLDGERPAEAGRGVERGRSGGRRVGQAAESAGVVGDPDLAGRVDDRAGRCLEAGGLERGRDSGERARRRE